VFVVFSVFVVFQRTVYQCLLFFNLLVFQHTLYQCLLRFNVLVGQTIVNKGANLKTRGIHPDLTWKLANSMSKAVRGKPKRSNDPTKQKESHEAMLSAKMQYIKGKCIPLAEKQEQETDLCFGRFGRCWF
jgi:hypothetical protein